MEIWKERRWEIKDLGLEMEDRERDFLREDGRRGNESFPARGSRRSWLERKASRPRLWAEQRNGIEEQVRVKKMRMKDSKQGRTFGIVVSSNNG